MLIKEEHEKKIKQVGNNKNNKEPKKGKCGCPVTDLEA